MKKVLLIVAAVIIGFASCNNSKQQTGEQVQGTDTTYVLPTPDVDLVLYSHEDIGNATEKIKKAFKLDGGTTDNDGHVYFTRYNDGIKTEYHVICAYDKGQTLHNDWFDYLTVNFSSDKPNAFDVLNELAATLNNAYKQDSLYQWDEEREQWTNGKQYVYIQEPTRDEKDGVVYSVCCIMPIDRVNK